MMHGKEQAIAPVFVATLNVIVAPAKGVATDALGTFSCEIPRHGTMLRRLSSRRASEWNAHGFPLAWQARDASGRTRFSRSYRQALNCWRLVWPQNVENCQGAERWVWGSTFRALMALEFSSYQHDRIGV
jgi:hypothetical protein